MRMMDPRKESQTESDIKSKSYLNLFGLFVFPRLSLMFVLMSTQWKSGHKILLFKGIAMNTTFEIVCSDWKDEGINIDRDTPITKHEFSLAYQVSFQKQNRKLKAALLTVVMVKF